jgi:Flp pilus assembly pilin Flp
MLLLQLDPKTREADQVADEVHQADEESGAVATEYGLLLLLIALVMILAVTAFGISVSGLFDRGVEPF